MNGPGKLLIGLEIQFDAILAPNDLTTFFQDPQGTQAPLKESPTGESNRREQDGPAAAPILFRVRIRVGRT